MRRAETHGVALVPRDRAQAAFERVAGSWLQERAFKPRNCDHAFVAPLGAGLLHLIELSPLKGGVCGFKWGVSLPYLPHEFRRPPRFHRTEASARFDLWSEAQGKEWERSSGYPNDVDAMHGEECLLLDLEPAWSRMKLPIGQWLDRARTDSGIADLADEQAAKPSVHWPRPRLVLAFAKAHAGDKQAAERELAAHLHESGDPAEAEATRDALKACEGK
jgi:hypothetical protein